MMILLTPEQCEWFLNFKSKFQSYLDKQHIDIIPIEIADGNFILPHEILSDDRYLPLRTELAESGDLAKINFIDEKNIEFKIEKPL